ncbi:MAG: hypothetical protein ABL921_02395 [Pirellula sp.]
MESGKTQIGALVVQTPDTDPRFATYFLPSARSTFYAPIVTNSSAQLRYLVTISHATIEMSNVHFPSRKIKGIPLGHLPWRLIKSLVDQAVSKETNKNKWILTQFSTYLGALLGMENKFSKIVYVVALGNGNPDGWKLSWIDIVEKRNSYFYPVGGGWPDPPNYIGFRYGGMLQSIRWVKSHTVFTNPRSLFPEAPKVDWQPHYLLTLDSPIIPANEIRTGNRINYAARCWCAIDKLLTSETVSEALTKTKAWTEA